MDSDFGAQGSTVGAQGHGFKDRAGSWVQECSGLSKLEACRGKASDVPNKLKVEMQKW